MPEFEYDAWFGVMAPANTPIAIRIKVSQDVAAVLRAAEVQKRWEGQGVVTVVNAPREMPPTTLTGQFVPKMSRSAPKSFHKVSRTSVYRVGSAIAANCIGW